MKSIEDKVKTIFTEYNDHINNDSKISEIIYDSIDFIEIIIQIEEEFGLSIDDETAQKFKTINDVIEFINKEKS